MKQTWRTSALSAGLSSMTEYKIPTVKELRSATESGNHKFEVVSLFAGGGGSSTGYRMAGGKVLAVNEFIPEAVKTYKANWPTTEVLPGDIRNLSGQEILTAIKREPGQLDILDGSPPCSAFSTAGSRDKGWGKTKKYSDASQKNVEDLFFEYIRVLRDIQPKVFVAENVSGLAKGVAKGYLNQILRELRASGYEVSCKVLDAQWLGVPQKRARTIFVGVRSDLWKPEFKGRLHPLPLPKKITLEEAFRDLTFTDNDRMQTDTTKYAVHKLLVKMKPGTQHQKRFNLVKCSKNSQANCLTATTGSLSAAKPMHWDNRAFTVSEVKRIMSVPDDYVLTGAYQQKVERLGRMVAPFMMRAVAQNILSLGVFDENAI
jgi:DNA (cytosine-5)-methyltransferase 1